MAPQKYFGHPILRKITQSPLSLIAFPCYGASSQKESPRGL